MEMVKWPGADCFAELPCVRFGCVVYGAGGEVLAKANREGREEILHYALPVRA